MLSTTHNALIIVIFNKKQTKKKHTNKSLTHPSFTIFNFDFNSLWDAILWSSQTFTYNTTVQTLDISQVSLHGYVKEALKSVLNSPFSHPCLRSCSSANFSPVLFSFTISAIPEQLLRIWKCEAVCKTD